jgi:hypothetical protein
MEKTVKWVKRQPLKAGLIALAVCALLAPLVVGLYYQQFILPWHARSNPLFTALGDRDLFLPLQTFGAGRGSANFSTESFERPAGGRYAVLEFLHVPAELLPSLACRVMADIAGAEDHVLSGIVRPGETVFVPKSKWRYRAYYIGTPLLNRRAQAATVSWIGGSGDWDSTANWSSAPALPGPDDDVVIEQAGDITVTHSSGAHSVKSILSQEAFVLSGGSVTVANTIQVNNGFILAGGTLVGATVLQGTNGQGIVLASGGGGWPGGPFSGTPAP